MYINTIPKPRKLEAVDGISLSRPGVRTGTLYTFDDSSKYETD
jgi:hypothetical protein